MNIFKYEEAVYGEPIQSLDTPRKVVSAGTLHPSFQIRMGVVYQLHLHPSVDGIKRIRSEGFVFPDECCVCGSSVVSYLPIKPTSWFEKVWSRFNNEVLPLVPHCELHSNRRYAMFTGQRWFPGRLDITFSFSGLNRAFLEAIQTNYCRGEHPPPWEYNTRNRPYARCYDEFWFHYVWRPFWSSLNKAERLDYLDRWNADESWRASFLEEDGQWRLMSE